MNNEEINPTDCSDEEIIKYIENVTGADTLHYKSSWIIMRTLKILVRDYLERHGAGSKKPGTLTNQEKKDLHDLSSSAG